MPRTNPQQVRRPQAQTLLAQARPTSAYVHRVPSSWIVSVPYGARPLALQLLRSAQSLPFTDFGTNTPVPTRVASTPYIASTVVIMFLRQSSANQASHSRSFVSLAIGATCVRVGVPVAVTVDRPTVIRSCAVASSPSPFTIV